MIEASGSSEAWYVPPHLFAYYGLARGTGASWRAGVGRVRSTAFLNSLRMRLNAAVMLLASTVNKLFINSLLTRTTTL